MHETLLRSGSRSRSSRPTRSPRSPTRRRPRSPCSSPRPPPRTSRAAGLDRDRGPACDRRPLLPPDRPRLRDERRRVRRGEGQPRHAAVPRRGSGASDRLRAHRRRLRHSRRLRDDLGSSVARGAQARLSLGFVALLTVANLRGVSESGVLFALPTYGFVAAMYALVAIGIARCAIGGARAPTCRTRLPAGVGRSGSSSSCARSHPAPRR